jgi:hypothetical protein
VFAWACGPAVVCVVRVSLSGLLSGLSGLTAEWASKWDLVCKNRSDLSGTELPPSEIPHLCKNKKELTFLRSAQQTEGCLGISRC